MHLIYKSGNINYLQTDLSLEVIFLMLCLKLGSHLTTIFLKLINELVYLLWCCGWISGPRACQTSALSRNNISSVSHVLYDKKIILEN